jgi:beta-lactamase regulating signal transducer with metallopeptidase domain/protocatechuate 3,4-dioxygenase beta subunit
MFPIASLNEFAETWRFYVWHAGWQGSLVALLVLGAVFALRRAPSPLRYGLLLLALLKFAMPPMLTAPTGVFRHLPVQVVETPRLVAGDTDLVGKEYVPTRALAETDHTVSTAPKSLGDRPVPSLIPSELPLASHALQPARESLSTHAWLMLLHLGGTTLFGAWLVLLFGHLLHAVMRSTSLTEGAVYDQFKQVAQALGVRRSAALRLDEHAPAPMAFGIFHPTVLLPSHFVDDLQADQLQTVLAHELGHHRRFDLWVNYLQLLMVALWWFNPLVWGLSCMLRRVREDCCDDLVLGLGLSTHLAYSETLIQVAAQVPARPGMAAALGFAESFHPLTKRIRRIVDSSRARPVRLSWLSLGVVLVMSGALLPGLHSSQGDAQARSGAPLESPAGAAAQQNAEPSVDAASEAASDSEELLKKTEDQTAGHAGVHGQVLLGADRRPVLGAVVHLLRRSRSQDSPKVADVQTDAQGQFVFKGVDPGEYRIWATQGDLVSRKKRYGTPTVKLAEDGSISEPIVLHLHRACVLRVHAVSSMTGQSLDQAQVFLPWSDVGHTFSADENGVVLIPSLTQESWHYEVIAPGHGRVTRVAKLQPDKKNTFEVRLPAGGTLSGRVTDPKNRGIAGVGVNLYPTGNGRPMAYVKTDKDGAYQLPYVPINTSVDLRYHYDNFVSASKSKVTLTEADQVRSLDVQLKPRPLGGSVTGVVRDQQGQPVPNARVIFHTGSTGDVRRVKTDASGRFRMDDIPERPGNMLLTVRANGYSPKNIEIKPGTQQTPQDLSIRLHPGHTVAGRVVDEAGRAISGVWIFAGGNRFPNRMGGNTHSDQDGRFAFDSLPATIQFDFEASGYSDIRNHDLVLDRNDHVIVMEKHGIIAGQLVDAETGAPIPVFNIKVRRSDREYKSSLPSALYRGVDISSEEGRFSLDGLTTGTAMMLFVKVPGSAVQVYDRVVVQAASSSEAVILKCQTQTGLLAGQLVDMNTHALTNLKMHVVVHKPEPHDDLDMFSWRMLNSGQLAIQQPIIQVQETITDAEGRFRFEGIPSGYAIDLMIQGEGVPKTRRKHIEKQSLADRAMMVIELPKASTVSGRINTQAYPNVGQLAVYLREDGFSRRTINIGTDQKTFAFTDLGAGSYGLTVYGKMQANNFNGTFSNPIIGTTHFDIKTAESKEINIGFSSPAQAETQGLGGAVVDGLQIHLWTDKRVWLSSEAPELKANALVLGEGELGFVDPPMGVFLEVDGVEYGIQAAGALSIGHAPIRSAMYGLGLKLKGDQYRDSKGQALVLTPGRHTIRLIVFAQATAGSNATPKSVPSNPVNIVLREESHLP